MSLSKIFIQRPVGTTILMIALIFAGITAYFKLPVSELPDIDFPTITVTASLPGADPQTMANSVATPLEKVLGTVPGIDSMNSISSFSNTQIVIQFNLDRNIDAAAQDVQSAILQATRRLPSNMPTPPIVRKLNPADAPVLFLAMTSKHMKLTDLNDYAQNVVTPQLSTIEGVANVNIFGVKEYAVRIHLNPVALANRGLSIENVQTALNNLNVYQPSGVLRTEGQYQTLITEGGLKNAAEFADSIIAVKNGAAIRLRDVARVEDSVLNDQMQTLYNDQTALVLAVTRQPDANTVALAEKVEAALPFIAKDSPGDTRIKVVYNRGDFIKEAIKDVELTLLFAILLVVLVVYLFLRRWSYTVIAALSIPTSVIGTFGIMYLCEYNIDNLSLMGLVLAVGFVIDDAIVVLENIVRYRESGLNSMQASLVGAGQVSFTVISMSVSLVAVFIPIFFMGGIVGRLFHEFAAVVGISILLSAVVALSLIPMLMSRFLTLKNNSSIKESIKPTLTRFQQFYEITLRWSLNNTRFMLLIAAILCAATIYLFIQVPKAFIPSEDSNIIFGGIEAPQGMNYADFTAVQNQIQTLIRKNSNVKDLISSIGQSNDSTANTSSGSLNIILKPRSERSDSADQVIQQLRTVINNDVPGINVYLMNPPAIRIGGKSSNSSFQYTLLGTQWDELQDAAQKMKSVMAQIPGIQDVDTDQLTMPEFKLKILRDKAAALGITPQQIESDLYAAYGQQVVTTILKSSGDYSVIMDIDPAYQKNLNALDSFYLISNTGNKVPLSAVVEVSQTVGVAQINHYGQLPSTTLSFSLAPGYVLGDVSDAIDEAAKNNLPPGVSATFVGTAQKFQESLKTLPLLLLATIIIIYMVLAILYENFIHPLTILTALPFAILGALISLLLFNKPLDLFSFIGLIMLVGLTKKNGIMMVDFALELKREKNLDAKEAIIEACLIRLRPIMMTTVAAIVATLPIAFGLGAGGEARSALGVAVSGGLLVSQLITLYITPVFYLLFDKIASYRIK